MKQFWCETCVHCNLQRCPSHQCSGYNQPVSLLWDRWQIISANRPRDKISRIGSVLLTYHWYLYQHIYWASPYVLTYTFSRNRQTSKIKSFSLIFCYLSVILHLIISGWSDNNWITSDIRCEERRMCVKVRCLGGWKKHPWVWHHSD